MKLRTYLVNNKENLPNSSQKQLHAVELLASKEWKLCCSVKHSKRLPLWFTSRYVGRRLQFTSHKRSILWLNSWQAHYSLISSLGSYNNQVLVGSVRTFPGASIIIMCLLLQSGCLAVAKYKGQSEPVTSLNNNRR